MKGHHLGAQTPQTAPPKTTLIDLFTRQALRSPHSIAINAFGEQVTFADLNSRANKLARYLQRQGVQADVLVGICLDRSLDMMIAVLAVLKAGGAYVPVDPGYPAKRFNYILSDSATPLVLTQQKHATLCSAAGNRMLCLDTNWPEIDLEAGDDFTTDIHPDNLAYVLYTSGSTGEPKGVAMPHGPLVNLLEWQLGDWTCSAPCPVLQFASLNFDVSFQEIFSTWCAGGTIVLIDDTQRKDPATLCRFLIEHRIGRIFLPYIALKHLAEFSVREQLFPVLLRDVITAGEQLQITTEITEFFKQLPNASLQNQYGPTETHVVTAFRLPPNPSEWNALPSIGTPIQNTHILLLNESRQPVQGGEVGELYIGGLCLARGYHNKTALSQERFVCNSISDSRSVLRLYKTGDLGRLLPDGNIEFNGRSDDQIKIRGYRIELGEIEVALRRHPNVAEASVLARTRSGVKQLIAYVVTKSDTTLSRQSLRSFLEEWLPTYSIPTAVAFLSHLPLSPNGKVDRAALLDVSHELLGQDQPFSETTDLKEQALVKIWCEVLDYRSVSIHDNFFDLGGDSILAIQMCAKMQTSGIKCSIEQLYANPTIAALAQVCENEETTSVTLLKPFDLVPAHQRDSFALGDLEDAYPMTRLQFGMVYHSAYNEQSRLYLEVFTYRLFMPLDEVLLRTAIDGLMKRHPVLRTSLDLGCAEPLQLVHRTAEPFLHIEDLRSLSAFEQTAALEAATRNEREKSFHLQTAPLLRFRFHLLDERALHLIFSFHHAILDGWSLATLIGELVHNYMRMIHQVTEEPRPIRFAFSEFVAMEQKVLASPECRNFWRKHLEGAELSPVSLQDGQSSSATPVSRETTLVEVSDDLRHGLLKVAREAGVHLKTVLHAAHLRVVSFLNGRNHVVSGLLLNTRPESIDADKALGLFVNTVPVQLKIPDGSWMDLIRHVSEVEREILPFRRYPLSQIQQENGKVPLFDSAFNFIHFHAWKHLEQFGNCEVLEGPFFESTNFALLTTFSLNPAGTQLFLRLDYDPTRFTPERIGLISAYYRSILQTLVDSPHLSHRDFSPLSPEEKNRLLIQLNATEHQYPFSKCIHTLFEEQAQENPQAIAIKFGETCLTYRELNEKANQFARRLREFGVTANTLVGVCLNRSIQMVVGLLAILKAGAAYVPLDPAYPLERLEFMVKDAKLTAIVTETKLALLFPSRRHLLFIDQPHDQPGDSRNLENRYSARALAYVIYTSGSTGRPKGVQIAHSSVVNVLYSVAELTGFTARDTIFGLTTVSFDIAVLEIFLPLITGAQLIVVAKETASDGLLLAEFANSSGATVIQGTPATWKMLLQAGWTGNKHLKVFCGGEPLQRALADELSSRSQVVWNLYGPTETTIYSTGWRVIPNAPISIGRPIANTQLYILDSNMQPVPKGVVGQLFIGGHGLAHGYLDRPDLNEDKFVRNPFSVDPADRLYATGDLARYLPDDNIFLLGRIDHQVKIRGHRIELGEIETRILEHDAVKEVVVTAGLDVTLENSLAAYIVLRAGSRVPISELRDYLKSKLPEFMVPSAFICLEKIPLTPNSKIDRRALPKPDAIQAAKETPNAPPRTPIEEALVNIWAEVLHRDNIGICDSFIELGGHSLSALQVVVRIKKRFGVAVPVRILLEGAAIAELAEYLFTTMLERSEDPEIKALVDRTYKPSRHFAGLTGQTGVPSQDIGASKSSR